VSFGARSGTAEAVPWQNPFMRWLVVAALLLAPRFSRGLHARDRYCYHLSVRRERASLTSLHSCYARSGDMCRNIKTLFNFDPPVTDEEIHAASLQFVRKISGFNQPSKANQASFLAAVEEVAVVSRRLLHSLETTAPPKNREDESAKAKARAAQRFGD